jgi:hypothetical protein
MGAFVGAGDHCDGEDILAQLNYVFGFPHLKAYKHAKEHNKFGKVSSEPGNYQELIDAYVHAGLEVTPTWAAYLKALGTVETPNLEQGAQNIKDIATYRDRNLKNNRGMRTAIHEPHDGGHVHILPGTGIDPEVVDSPYPLSE